ncbi:hypothetical protein A6F49_12535 [Enteractinococcus helveticum]|uniref:FlgD/Vpr Ig-like domain-containing protein n=2 Tax=Enteractinococcus helveticum TaxID=1837282 RepID=A0A1B7LY48_9MICC|nr:hypothetical protein A6F49_12535 [Enteractinococcus helveticum]
MVGAMPANANDGDHRSHALAELVNADLLGADLADVGFSEQNFTQPSDGPSVGTVDANLLDRLIALNLGGISLPILGDGLTLGAVNSYAEASSPTEALAAAGVITSEGAIDISGDEDPYGYAEVDVTDALGQLGIGLEGVIDGLGVDLGALASRAEAANGDINTEYTVAGARLALDAPILDQVSGLLEEAVGRADSTINGLLGDEGLIQGALDDLTFDEVGGIDLGIPGVSVLSADLGTPELQAQVGMDELVQRVLSEPLESDVTTIDLENGQIYIDLAQLHGGNPDGLNGLDANTQLIRQAEIDQITSEVTDLLASELIDRIETAIEDSVNATEVTLTLDPEISALQIGPLPPVVSGDPTVTIDTTLGSLLGVGEEITEDDLDIAGNLTVIGIPIPVFDLLGELAEPILGQVVPEVVSAVTSNLNLSSVVGDSLNGVLNTVTDPLDPVLEEVLAEIINVTVNAQWSPGNLGDTSLSVSPLRIDILQSINAVELPLATSTVYAEDAADYEPTVLAEPNPAEVGNDVAINGSDFVPNSTVTVTITDVEDNVVYENDSVDVLDDGSFENVWTIGDDVIPGDYTVDATDNDNQEITATDSLTIEEAAVYDPSVLVEPNAAQADDAVDITGGDFAPESELTIDIYDANDVQVGAVEGVSTDAEGNFTTPWTIPTDTDPGELTITVTDGEDNSANQTLDVYAPTVTPEPSSQTAGEPVELTGAGFVPNSTLTVEIAGADGVIATLDDVAVNDAGTFAEDWTIPAGTEPSELTVTASDNANELIFASANVTVEEPADDDADAADTDADADADGIDADSDAVDADATDATDTDAADTDSADADATDADAADADADAADTDATDADGVDADVDAADTDAADTDVTDADAVDADADADGIDADSDAVDADATDATDTDAVDTDSADADVTDADAAAADATDADATDVTDADAVDGDAVDTDATDADATDGDGTDTDTDAVDADATDGDTDSGYEAEVNVKPSDIEAGGTVTIEGNDFAPGSTVDVVITDADGAHIATIEDVQVDDAGEFSVDWDVPADTAAGTYTVTATDTQDEDLSGSDEFTVSEVSDTDAGATDGDDANEYDPSINVDPDTATPGEEVTIEGDDFGPEETVTIEITDEDGNVIDTITVVTDDNGDFSVTWTVPQDVAPGTLTITAADESGNTATAELTISAAGAGDSDSGDALASTGAKATMIATAIALLLIVIGAGLLIARRNNTVNDAS